jgi:hypothetical protein
MSEKTISDIIGEHEKIEVIKIIIEALQKTITEDTGPVVQRLCDKCIHYPVCYPRLVADEKELLRLSRCEFYQRGEK